MNPEQSTRPATGRDFIDTGLDFATEAFSEEERVALVAWYRENHDYKGLDLAAFARFQVEHDPGGFKRLRRYIFTLDEPRDGVALPTPMGVLLFVYTYTVLGFGKGAFYEVIAMRNLGTSKAEILETIRLAALVSGPLGLNPLGELMTDYLGEWADGDGPGVTWPEGWETGPAAVRPLRSGIDLTTDDLTDAERELVFDWYRGMYGEVPLHVERLAAMHPRALKTQRVRFEGALSGALPAQFVPLLEMHLAAIRAQPGRVRRAAQMARALGVRRHQFVSGLLWAAVYGGDVVLEPAFESCADIFGAWE